MHENNSAHSEGSIQSLLIYVLYCLTVTVCNDNSVNFLKNHVLTTILWMFFDSSNKSIKYFSFIHFRVRFSSQEGRGGKSQIVPLD